MTGDQNSTMASGNEPTTSFNLSALLPTSKKLPSPLPDRETTCLALDALLNDSVRPSPSDVYGSGPLLLSNIPQNVLDNKERGVILGIDEAGRGPVLGPMTYAAAYWLPDSDVPKDFNDSKQLTPEKRAALFKQIRASNTIGFVLRVLHASEISRNMLRKVPYNLNAISHDAAMEMIWGVIGARVKIDTCYIDTVGNPDSYKAKLDRVFQEHNIQFVVEKKADAKYATCSAASVVAKQSRDLLTANWQWTETNEYEPREGKNFGSGYPADPACKKWMESNCNLDPPFGFPDFVRFSWGPAKNALKGEGGRNDPIIRWEADEEEEDESGGKQSSLDVFVVTKSGDKRKRGSSMVDRKKRLGVFNELGMSKVMKFVESS